MIITSAVALGCGGLYRPTTPVMHDYIGRTQCWEGTYLTEEGFSHDIQYLGIQKQE